MSKRGHKIKVRYRIDGVAEFHVDDETYANLLESDFDDVEDCEAVGIDASTILDQVGQCDGVAIEWLNPPKEAP